MLALARDFLKNERSKLILDIYKTINEVFLKKNTKELSCPYCDSIPIVKDGKNKIAQERTTAKLRGMSKMQVCILTALDSKKSIVIEPSCMGRPPIFSWLVYLSL